MIGRSFWRLILKCASLLNFPCSIIHTLDYLAAYKWLIFFILFFVLCLFQHYQVKWWHESTPVCARVLRNISQHNSNSSLAILNSENRLAVVVEKKILSMDRALCVSCRGNCTWCEFHAESKTLAANRCCHHRRRRRHHQIYDILYGLNSYHMKQPNSGHLCDLCVLQCVHAIANSLDLFAHALSHWRVWKIHSDGKCCCFLFLLSVACARTHSLCVQHPTHRIHFYTIMMIN